LKVLIALIFVAGSFLLLRQAGQLSDIAEVLKHARVDWVIIGLVATALSYATASLTQYAAGSWQGSFSRIHLLQWAGNFINRFLPLNIGSTALMARHYQKQGRRPAEALTVATLPTLIGYAKNIIPILFLSPFTIAHILKRHPLALPPLWLLPIVVIILVAAFLIGRKFKKRIRQFLTEARGGLASVKDPWQLTVLLSGSVAYTLLASAALLAAIQAVGASLPLSDIFTLYVLSMFAGSALPTPGGIGSTEAALVAGLTSLGIGISTAVSITLLFRLMTFWAPLIPGSVALHFFRKHA
jgi:undecaprenyl-diphosphatase